MPCGSEFHKYIRMMDKYRHVWLVTKALKRNSTLSIFWVCTHNHTDSCCRVMLVLICPTNTRLNISVDLKVWFNKFSGLCHCDEKARLRSVLHVAAKLFPDIWEQTHCLICQMTFAVCGVASSTAITNQCMQLKGSAF